ncbi:sortase domain-containing protein [Pseudolactococcus reticulitermitis]|uniref:Sortase n=1 Tax=Pseudolactococcus reticulitermitis TaxID=2025039 RepID=A0A224X0U7_9LACT|nr:sortase [Lactococcus reticulitermitis]GAX47838.1 hypothetical protein RsY01_1442 [Lactococcus reticulitermitis]
MTERQLVRKNKNAKNRVSTLVLVLASLVMVSTIIFLVKNDTTQKTNPSLKTVRSDASVTHERQTSSKISDIVKNQRIPMQEEDLDFDESLDRIGQVIVDKVGMTLPIVKGRGKEDGTGFDKAIYACTNKKNQILGLNNYVLSAHSNHLSATDYFSPLLVYDDDSFDLTRSIEPDKLKLKMGDEIMIDQYSDQMRYRFKISNILMDDGQGNFLATYQAMGDKSGQAELTLYTCSDVVGEKRLVIQANFVAKQSL